MKWRNFNEILQLVGSDWDNFTRFVSTKSLEQCCNKEYIKFDGMKSMFLGQSEQDSRWDIHGGSEVPENKKSNKSCFSRLQKAFQTHSQKFIYLFSYLLCKCLHFTTSFYKGEIHCLTKCTQWRKNLSKKSQWDSSKRTLFVKKYI